MDTDDSEKLFNICLQVLIWFWITALGRGFGFPELDEIPVGDGRRTPRVISVMVRVIRKKMAVFLFTDMSRNAVDCVCFSCIRVK